MVVSQHAPEALAAPDDARFSTNPISRVDDPVLQPLVVTLNVEVGWKQDDPGFSQIPDVLAEREELGIAVDEDMARVFEEAAAGRQVACDLLDPAPIWDRA